MPSIDDMLSLYTRAMRSMHACIEPCIEKTLPIHARSYFMSGNMSARKINTPYANICAILYARRISGA
jgi:hypothetical protein